MISTWWEKASCYILLATSLETLSLQDNGRQLPIVIFICCMLSSVRSSFLFLILTSYNMVTTVKNGFALQKTIEPWNIPSWKGPHRLSPTPGSKQGPKKSNCISESLVHMLPELQQAKRIVYCCSSEKSSKRKAISLLSFPLSI